MSSRAVDLGNVVCTVAVAIGLPSPSAAQQPVVIPVEPPTRLEALMARDGVVMVCGSSRVGAVRSEAGTVIAVASQEVVDTRSGERAVGVAVEVRGVERREPDRVSYVDLEEIPSLLTALEYMSRLERTATALDRFAAHYATRGGVVVSVFDVGFGMKGALCSGRAGAAKHPVAGQRAGQQCDAGDQHRGRVAECARQRQLSRLPGHARPVDLSADGAGPGWLDAAAGDGECECGTRATAHGHAGAADACSAAASVRALASRQPISSKASASSLRGRRALAKRACSRCAMAATSGITRR